MGKDTKKAVTEKRRSYFEPACAADHVGLDRDTFFPNPHNTGVVVEEISYEQFLQLIRKK
ncbi:MAG: hypothetical protein ACREUA_02035 [Burkholderiales bacterium]